MRRSGKSCVVAGFFFLAWVSLIPATQAQELMRVGLTSLSPTTLPVWVAKRQGFFKEQGLNVEPIVFTSGTINSQAALAGEIDVALGSGTEVFTIRLAGEDARFFFGISNFMPFKLFVNPNIKTPADLNDIITDWPYLGYYAMAGALKNKRDKISRFLRAHVKGLEWLRANPSGGVKVLVEDVKISPDYAEAGYKEFMKSFAFDGRVPVKGFELLMESEGPKVKGKFKVADFIDESFHKQFAKN